MHNQVSLHLPSNRQIPCKLLLLLGWFLGLTFGIFFASNPAPYIISLMRSAPLRPVSIVGLLAVLALPFLITAFAVFISRPLILIPLAFLKAFSFSACAVAVDRAFFSAGWLLRSLLMFSDLMSLPVLLWLWLRFVTEGSKRSARDLMIGLILLVLVGSIDYCLISPSLAMLFS